MATTYDVLRIRAVASVDFEWDALFAATISVETFQRCFARLLSFRSGFPTAIWQSDQYSPVIPATRGLAASNACVAAPWPGDFMNSCIVDSATRKGIRRFLWRPVPLVAPGCNELTAIPCSCNRRDSSLAYSATANLDCP